MTTTTTMIREREHGIAFEGSPEEAMEFVSSTRAAYAAVSNDMPPALSDLIFKLEVALQHAGLLDDDFNPTTQATLQIA
jgi:hypothetical protein